MTRVESVIPASVVALLLCLAAQANAEELLVLEYIPEPVVIVRDGVAWYAYDFEGIRELAAVDVRLQVSKERVRILRESLEEHETALAESEAAIQEMVARAEALSALYEAAEAANEDALTRLEGCQTALGLCEQRESGAQFWHPVYVPLVAVLSVSLVLALR